MNPLLLLCIAAGFLITLLSMPVWIRRAKSIGMVGRDMHKPNRPEVAEMGGICVVAGFVGSVFIYIGLETFYFSDVSHNIPILALLNTVLIACVIGIMDDVLGWKKGLRQSSKFLLTIPAAVPMMVINAGTSVINMPFIGLVDMGILYPLLLVPIGIIGASNAFNMIAGYNGLEAGMGAIILGALAFVAWSSGMGYFAMIAAIAAAALLAFMRFNWVPAKVFPGNVMTYAIGATIACVAILTNAQKIALMLFALYFIEFALKLRGRFKKESFGKSMKDGSVEMRYDKIYGLEHVAIRVVKAVKGKCYERDVTIFVLGLQALLTLAVLVLTQ